MSEGRLNSGQWQGGGAGAADVAGRRLAVLLATVQEVPARSHGH